MGLTQCKTNEGQTVDRFLNSLVKEHLAGLNPEERLAGLNPEERLAGLGVSVEERLAGLFPEQIEAYLQRLRHRASRTQKANAQERSLKSDCATRDDTPAEGSRDKISPMLLPKVHPPAQHRRLGEFEIGPRAGPRRHGASSTRRCRPRWVVAWR